MPSVRVKERQPFDVALRRFKRSCEKAGIVSELRRREYLKSQLGHAKEKKLPLLKALIRAI